MTIHVKDDFTVFSTANFILFCHLQTLFLAIRLSCEQCFSEDSNKIMFHSIFRRVPESFYRIRTLKGVSGYSLIWVQRVKPVGRKMVQSIS